MSSDEANRDKARTIVRNLARGWNRAVEDNKMSKNVIRHGTSSTKSINKGKFKKKLSFGTAEYKHPRIL